MRELLVVGGAIMAFAVIGIPLGWLLTDLATSKVGLGQPLTGFQAWVLRLDPADYVAVDSLSVGAREVLRDRVILVGVALTLIGTPWGIWLAIWWIQMQQRVNQSLRQHMMHNVHGSSMRKAAEAKVGDSIYRAFQDSAQVTNLLGQFVTPVPMIFTAIGTMISILAFEWWLPLVVASGLAALFVLGAWASDVVRRDFRRMREENSLLTSGIQETLSGIKVVKANAAEARFQARFEAASRSAFEAAYRARVRFAGLQILAFTLTALIMIPLAAVLALKAADGAPILAGGLIGAIGFATWSLAVYQSATSQAGTVLSTGRSLLGMWIRAQDMAVGMDRAFTQVDVEVEVRDAAEPRSFEPPREAVRFLGVHFAYVHDRPVLRGVDLEARVGEVTGILGPTGSGKTTLASLLLRLFDPDAGRIEVDGIDLREFDLDSLRRGVSIALQENLLFGTTIRENIRYAVPNATDEAVRAAAEVACACEFIETLPLGYDTELGERGARLSSGQRQRRSHARGIIKDSPVLILDEPTAALDAETEARVLENLARWGAGRVILLITHRLSTIRRADRIVVLDEGVVAEAGSPDALLAREAGAYRRFVELELGAGEDGEHA